MKRLFHIALLCACALLGFVSNAEAQVTGDSVTISYTNNRGTKYYLAVTGSNNNYSITECGAIILRDTGEEVNNIKIDTPKIMIGKSNNSCELGNIFAIRKNNVSTNNKFYARGYIKYKDQFGNEYINYSMETIKGVVD
jgi:hypothetical protein